MTGKPMDPDDKQEFINQVNSEPDEWMMICKAYPPKVTVKNDIFPRQHEIYNCTSCRRGRELPQFPKDTENYNCRCTWDGLEHIGPRWNDTGCSNWDRKIPIPKHGFMPRVESGSYDKRDRR
jgi:hypothetical protein